MSHSHKTSNTFVFKSFNELVDEINISHQRLLHENQAPPEDENESYFGLALQKWCDLNACQHFVSFRREVESKACSYELVILHKDQIAEALLRHLVVPHSMALAPLLDLVVQLGRDLRSEFYGRYFEKFCETLIKLIDVEHRNSEVLNDVFMCLTFLFQTLFRLILKDIGKIFRLICPLLIHPQSYIRMFAAESFSFLVRKHKDPAELFDYIFKKVHKNRDLVDGVGQLLFETVKGVQKQFNRVAARVIPVLLDKLDGEFSEAAGETLCVMWQLMAEHTSPDHSASVLQNLIEKMKSAETRNLKGVIKLFIIWINRNSGMLISDKEGIVAVVASLIERRLSDEETLAELFTACSCLLLAKNVDLDAHHRTRLLSTVFRSQYRYEQLSSFIDALYDLPCFEKDALLYLVEYASKLESPSDALLLVSKLLVHKLPQSVDVCDLTSLRPYILDFSLGGKQMSSKFLTWLSALLDEFSRKELISASELPELWAMIRCLPHLRPINRSIYVEMMSRLMRNVLQSAIDMSARNQDASKQLSILREAVVALSYLVDYDQLLMHLPCDIPFKLLSKFGQNEDSLCIVGFYLTCAEDNKKDDLLSKDEFEKVFPLLEANISSPYSQLRHLTLHIFSRFKLEVPSVANPNDDARNVFQVGLDAELIPASFQRYRDKLVQLNKLNCKFVVSRLPTGVAEKVPLDYLIAQLHVNFDPLWKHVMELIKSYANAMKLDFFWETYARHLTHAAHMAEAESNGGSNKNGCTLVAASGSLLSQLFDRFGQRNAQLRQNDRLNFSSFRNQLWAAMQGFPHVCEPRSRIIIPTFFQFLENEYLRYSHDVSSTATQDLRLRSADAEDEDMNEAVEEEEEPMEPGDAAEQEKADKPRIVKPVQQRIGKKALDRILVVHLNLFALFHDGKSLLQAQRLLEFYLDLLKHQSPVVQKAAFDCIMTYKPKYLVPYRENFERLISEKTFRNEVVLFSINAESQVINTEHRKDLIPILMRILYGKMRLRLGRDANGRAQGQARKNVVLAFLANSRPEEINYFLDLILQPFHDFFTDNLSEKVKEIVATVDVSKAVPLRKQQSVLTSVEMIFLKLGNIIGLYLPKLIQLVVGLGAYVAALLSRRSEIAPKCIALLKTIRNALLARIDEFFNQFDKYPWSVEEVEAIFEALVWPQIEKLPVEGIHNPTGLLRLCLTWSSNPRYFCLLMKCSQSQPTVIPLPLVLKLLEVKNVERSVTDVVMNLVENLLMEEEEEEEEEAEEGEEDKRGPPINPGSMWKIPLDNGVRYGTAMVMLFAQFIMPYLVQVIKGMTTDSRSKRLAPPKREIRILTCLSAHVTDADQCCVVASLLLQILELRRNLGAETEADLLTSVKNTGDKIDQPVKLLPMMWRLFDCLTEASSRMQLCAIMKGMATKEPLLQKTASVAHKLNSWQENRLNEPDYELRDDGFKEAMRIVAEPEPDVNFLLMIVHNCCYFTTTPNDTSSACLNKVILKMSEHEAKSEIFQEVVVRHLLPLVKQKLKVKDKLRRSVFVEKLRLMVLQFTDCSHFASLRCLLNENDRERDFFLNLIHIQVHRQARAVQDLAEFLRRNKMPSSVLISYLMPLVMAILRNDDDFSTQHVLRDFAIKALGSLCLRLPWESYCTALLSCLRALLRGAQSTKLNVRILVAVLNSFHFDLCNSQFQTNVPYTDKLETKVTDGVAEAAEGKDEADESPLGEDAAEQMDAHENDAMATVSMDTAVAGADPSEDDADSERMDVCAAGRATYIHRTIMMKILPQLQKCLMAKAKSDDEHKLARTEKVAQDIEILRVPLTVAIVKLLKVLPNAELEKNLSGILMKVIRFLQSRAKEIRLISYDTLRNIAVTLGPFYLKHVVTELKLMLTRGYQLHVLCHAIWCLLDEFRKQNAANLVAGKKPFIQPGDIDSCVSILTQVFNMELFDEVAEEKQVEEIAGKLFEAKRTKSGDSYGLLAAFVSEDSFPILIYSLKKVLEATHSHKIVNTVSNVLTVILGSVVENVGLSLRFLMEFIHAVTSSALTTFKSTGELKLGDSKADPRLRPPNCLLLKRAPPRGGKKPKTDARANLHVLIDFGFQLLHKLLNLSRIVITDQSNLELVDPFVGLMTASLDSKHVKVTSSALKCLSKICELPVPSLQRHFHAITNHLFVLLQGYTVAGSGNGPNEEMVAWSFKAITALIKHQRGVQITSEQLHVLLLYAEQDINDFSRHATAFPLLSAIVARRLDAKELLQIMIQMELMSIREIPEVQSKCRKVISSYLLNYPLRDKQLEKHLDFYVTQLSCEFMSGRQGAIEMLKDFFKKFPQEILSRWKFKFFVPLVQSCAGDVDCRPSLLDLLKQFLARLDSTTRDELISCCCTMMKDKTAGVVVSGAIAVGCIVEVEKDGFRRHLESLLPLIRAGIDPERSLDIDVLYFNIELLFKIFTECEILRNPKFTKSLNGIWECIERHLKHGSCVIQLKTGQLFLKLFESWTETEVVETQKSTKEYLVMDTDSKLYNLCGSFCHQFSAPEITGDLASTVMCNLLFLGRVLLLRAKSLKMRGEETLPKTSFWWLLKRLCKDVKEEIRKRKRESIIKRQHVFSWMEGIAQTVDFELVVPYLSFMLKPLIREQADSETDGALKEQTERVLKAIEARAAEVESAENVELNSFETAYRTVQKKLLNLKRLRKDLHAAQAVTDPEGFAKKKLKKNLAKKDSKKRKAKQKRPSKGVKRRRLS